MKHHISELNNPTENKRVSFVSDRKMIEFRNEHNKKLGIDERFNVVEDNNPIQDYLNKPKDKSGDFALETNNDELMRLLKIIDPKEYYKPNPKKQ